MNDGPINLSEVTASVANQQISEVKNWIGGSLKRFWTKNVQSFRAYTQASFKRYSETKTLLYKDSPVKVAKIYVQTRLKSPSSGEIISDTDILELVEEGIPVLITATAGAGKTFFAKYIFLSAIQRRNCIPIMVELRNVDDFSDGVVPILNRELSSGGFPASIDVLEKMIATNRFLILLDGYDEVESSKLELLNKALLDFSKLYPECPLVVTSRPDEKLEYLSSFRNYQVLPLELDQATQLVSKLTYDPKVKDLFLKDLKAKLFQTHKDFTSNPLLLTILLMTYGEIAEIPTKMHIFYEQAFDVLFYKHDVSKGMFRREIKSELAADDFKDLLACVSASGYVRQKSTFTNTDLMNFIRRGKKITGLSNLNPEAYKSDLLSTVCILVQDGLKYTYNHRSFQEYFSANFIVKFSSDQKFDIYWKFLERGIWDNALYLAFEMNRDVVEREFIYPGLCSLLEEMGEDDLGALRCWCDGFQLRWIGPPKRRDPSYFLVNQTRNWNFTSFVERLYLRGGKGKLGSKTGKPLSFRYILTKKRFKEILPKYDDNIDVNIKKPSEFDMAILSKSGIFETVPVRKQKLNQVKDSIENRLKRRNSENVEDWL